MKNNMMKMLGTLVLALALMISIIPGANAETCTFSNNCYELVAKFEGCRLEAYKCPAGVWTIGYGHTEGVRAGMTLANIEEARKILNEDLAKCSKYVNRLIDDGTISFEMNQNRFDALVSFTFNCGVGNLTKLVKGSTAEEVALKILDYNRGGGKILPGLTKRRQAERDLFVK